MVGKSIPRHILCAAGYKAQPPRNHACELRCESPVLAHIPHAQPVTAREATREEQVFFYSDRYCPPVDRPGKYGPR